MTDTTAISEQAAQWCRQVRAERKTGKRKRTERKTYGLDGRKRFYTADEIRELKTMFPKLGYKGCVKCLERHTISSIQSKAKKLRVPFSGRWNGEETLILETFFPGHGVAGCIAAGLDRSVQAIRMKACKLGIRRLPA